MTNRDAIRRHLAIIDDNIKSLDFYVDTEIVGDDARHLMSDIKGAEREFTRTNADRLEEAWDIKPLYDRLKAIQTSLRVLRNTMDLSDKAIEKALESCNSIAAEVEDQKPGDEDL
jgi:hypothetical protein